MKTVYWFLLALIFTSCHLPSADTKYADAANKTYKLHLNPSNGSSYHYNVTNTTEMEIEADDNKVESTNKSVAGITYTINKDSSGNYLFNTKYDKLHLKIKNGENETEFDADNGRLTSNISERMLGLLKDASLTAIVTSAGDVKEIKGYKDLSIQFLSMLDPNDLNARQLAQRQLDKQIGGEMIKNTMNQLFKIFPDSAVHVGDKWKINLKSEGQLPVDTKTYFKLTDITNEIAFVTSSSEITSDNTPISLNGYDVVANLKGTQEAKYQIETKTGMLVNSETESEIKGKLQMMGKEIPVSIKVKIVIEGKRLK